MVYALNLSLDSLDNDALAAAVHEQWLFSNIKLSTEPTLSLPSSTDTPKKFIFSDNIVLQINSVVDIGASLLSQYTQLTYDFEDNSGFIVSDDNEKDTDTASTIIKPRRMLLMELTDGQTMVKAIEYRPIRQLSLLTCPGCKILLFGSIICRRNILLLTESSCVVLGGEDETLMKTNRPVEVMARALGKQVRSKIPRDKQSTAACGRGVSSAHRDDRTDKSYAVEVNAIQYNSSSEAQIAGELERRRVPSDWLQSSPVATPLT
ncbi:unnamed protein product [Toxocara canis]|uniref:RecQ-mediated genome instability protein 1 n=1 Tax=Toxocara canis TaxID=6265 RepID=A0A183VG14_TOXCA|nr:unnamed protein product [Toxocara canis]